MDVCQIDRPGRASGPCAAAFVAIAVVAAATGAHCAGGLEIPEPPDVSAREARYDNPTAALTSETAGAVLDAFAVQRSQLELDTYVRF